MRLVISRQLVVLPMCLMLLPSAAAEAAVVETVERVGALEEKTRVFVFDLESAGVDESVAKQVATQVAEALHAVGSYDVLTPDDVSAVLDLQQNRELLACEDDTACLAQISERVNAELVVSGTVGKVGSEVMLSLSVIEAKVAKVRERVSGAIGTAAEHPARVAALVQQLMGVSASEAARFSLPDGADLSFAVFDLTAAGVTEDVATNLTQVLSTEIKRVDGASVIGKDDVSAMLELEATKSAVGCSDSTECLAEIGGALGVERIVTGHVGKVADSYVVSLRLISTREVKVENRVSETFRGLEAQTLNAVRHAGRKLLGIDDESPATLALSSPHEGATAILDGAAIGTFPLPPVTGLAPGRHELRVSLPRHKDLRSDIYVGPGETVSQWVELERLPDEWYESWVFWTVAGGATVVTAAVAAGGAFIGYQLWDDNRAFPLEVKASVPARGASAP
jgi:TolB-like protein